MIIPSPFPPTPTIFLWTNCCHVILAESKGSNNKNKKTIKTTRRSKANGEMMGLVEGALCCWTPGSWFSALDAREPKAERGQDGGAGVPQCVLVESQDSPAHWCAVASRTRSSGENPDGSRWLLGQGTVVYGGRQWSHWQWSSMALVHHGGLQGGLLR